MRSTTLSNNSPVVEFIDNKIDAIFAGLDQCRLPGAAVGIAIWGKPVYRKGFGLASIELPVSLTPTIRMRIASITKHFTCLAYMLQCEEGKAHIDDPIGKYLPELHSLTHKVTMRQLMGNTGGLRDVHDISWQFSGVGWPVSSAALLALYRDIDDVNFVPGSNWFYSNGGFLMLSVAIERITGQSLENVLRERIFEPIGMYDTLLRRFDTGFVPNSATLHVTDGAGGFRKADLGTAFAGEGGMVSTINDMLRWLAHMDAPIVGSAATWQVMKTPQVLSNGTSTGYGLGLMVGEYRGVETLYHLGGALGGRAHMLKVPSVGLDVIVISNRDDVLPMQLAERITDACIAGLNPINESTSTPLSSGVFRSPTSGRVIQLFANEGEQIVSIDGTDMMAEPDEHGVLRPVGNSQYRKQTITLAGDVGNPTSIRFNDFGNIDDLIREKPGKDTDASAVAGRYRSDAAGVEATIVLTADGPRLITTGQFGSAQYTIRCIANGVWRAESAHIEWLGGILSFDSDIGAFHFSNWATFALTFRRVS